jgi:flagellar biosynthesis protein FliR
MLRVELAWVAVVLLVTLRVMPLFLLAPVFGSVPAPNLFRAALAFALAALIVAATGTALPAAPASVEELAVLALGELVIGAALAFGLAAAFAAFLFGGRLLDMQFGFGIANLIDPVTRTQAPLLGIGLNMLAVAVFFLVDGHHLLIRALAFSLEQFPPGRSIAELNFSAVVAQAGAMFTLGLMLAAPAVFAVLLLDIGFALVARTMPQMNVFIIAIPFKVALGILVLALSMRYIGAAMGKVFESVFRYWTSLLT